MQGILTTNDPAFCLYNVNIFTYPSQYVTWETVNCEFLVLYKAFQEQLWLRHTYVRYVQSKKGFEYVYSYEWMLCVVKKHNAFFSFLKVKAKYSHAIWHVKERGWKKESSAFTAVLFFSFLFLCYPIFPFEGVFCPKSVKSSPLLMFLHFFLDTSKNFLYEV